MINRSRSRHLLLIACGFLLLLLGIVELITENHADNIVVTSFGIYLIVVNGYVYLHPSTSSSCSSQWFSALLRRRFSRFSPI